MKRNKHNLSFEGKTMLGMTFTPHLLLAALAVLAGMRRRVDGAMTCYDTGIGDYKLRDTAKCWAPEINATFNGEMTGCSIGVVSVQPLHLVWSVCVSRGCNQRAWYRPPLSLFSIVRRGGELKKSRKEDVRTGGKSPLYSTDSVTLSLAAVISLD